MNDCDFEFIRRVVYERSRINLSDEKRQLVSARLGKRLRATNLATVADYCRLLRSPEAEPELGHLIDAISTNHTYFFREPAHFDALRERVVPALGGSPGSGRRKPFRVWSAACSSGEEPYSLAITLTQSGLTCPWQIEATDISRRVLAKAGAGIYSRESVEVLPADIVRAYFQRGLGPQTGFYRVRAPLREAVGFHQLNLLEGAPPFREAFDVIFCRNVMIYFDRPTQSELVARLVQWLVPGGFLFVGHSESLTHLRHELSPVLPAVYRKPPLP